MMKTNEEIVQLAKQHGLDIKEDSLQRNDSGLDFHVVFATGLEGEDWVLRIPRRSDVVKRSSKEKQILDLVGRNLSVQAPKWKIYSEELIAYPLLQGVPAGTIDMEAKAYVWEIDEKNLPDTFVETLAKAMVELHSINHSDAKNAGLSIHTPEELRHVMKERMDKVKAEFGVSAELWKRWETWLQNDSLWPEQTALVHGDLHAGHILVDKESRVTGMIDWTEASVTDPANDFVSYHATFGEAALEKLIHAYEQAGGHVWEKMFDHIVELAAAYPVAIAEFALSSGLEEYEEMAKQALGVKTN
jgi:macrolide phosphotransferase